MAGVLVLALRPGLDALVRVGLVRGDEVEAAPRRAGEVDDDPSRPRRRWRSRRGRCAGGCRRRCSSRARRWQPHAADIELHGVELERSQAVVHRAEGMGDATADALLVEVEGDVEAHVLDVGDAVTGVARLVAGQREVAGAVRPKERRLVTPAAQFASACPS